MENHSSREKLVAAEAGLMPPQRLNDLPLFATARRERNPLQCMKYVYILLASMLLGVVSYEIWRTIRRDQFINEIETEYVESSERQLPLIPEDPRIKDIAERLERVLHELEEMQKKSDQEDEIPARTEIPVIGSSWLDVYQKTDVDPLSPEDGIIRALLPLSSDFKQKQYPILPFIDEDVIPDIDNPQSSMQDVEADETEQDYRDSIDVLNVTESPGTEETSPETTDSLPRKYGSDHNLPTTTIMPVTDVTEDGIESSEGEEKVEEKIDNVEIQGSTTVLDDDYPFDDQFFYEETFMPEEYISWMKGDLGSEDLEKLSKPTIDKAPVSAPLGPTPSTNTFSSDYASQSSFGVILKNEDVDGGSTEMEEYGGESDPEEMPAILLNTYTGDRRYIIKRSVDEPQALARPGVFLSPKALERKMVLIQQAIDDDNHLLQNEVSLTSGPTQEILQAKLGKFYAKMEAVSAHIDQLHERYLRLNKLEDDYVSREFPNEDMDATWTPNN